MSAIWIGGALTAGAAAAVVSWTLRSADPWWSTMLANAAVVVLLLAPGELLLRRIRTVERAATVARATADTALTAADEAHARADEAIQSLGQIQDVLVSYQHEELEADLDLYRRIVTDVSRESLIAALRHATDEGVIVPEGVRSPVWWTELHYRYVLEGDELSVNLEEDDGTVLSTRVWSRELQPIEFFQGLVQDVRSAGSDLGAGLNLPTESLETLSAMLVDVTRLRSQEPLGHRDVLRDIIEQREGWYFTSRHIIVKDHLTYRIGVDQLGDRDWEEHLTRKGWYDSAAAIAFARRLYGVPMRDST